jgi:hypothetical protein
MSGGLDHQSHGMTPLVPVLAPPLTKSKRATTVSVRTGMTTRKIEANAIRRNGDFSSSSSGIASPVSTQQSELKPQELTPESREKGSDR